MGYLNLQQCVADLEANGHLLRIDSEVDANLEAAEIHRRVCANGGPALLFANVKDCKFPMVSNLFGTLERVRYLFRDTLPKLQKLIELKGDPQRALAHPTRYASAAFSALNMRPKVRRRGPAVAHTTTLSQLPQLKSWPDDGGPFVTLPIVYSEDPDRPGWQGSNLGMYRIQLAGNEYRKNEEIGLHYQLHRGIGVHQSKAMARGEPFRVNIFVGGAPAMSVSAVMPLPEGMPEVTFAGALAGHRMELVTGHSHLPIYGQADFCICGTVDPSRMLPEGPFGDHLGYYSLEHEFPVLKVEQVYHRTDAIWPFTVVGRPPQEDSFFGAIIHELTGDIIPTLIPGLRGVNAVDAAGVHPLMLAVGSERYLPFQQCTEPREILTQANAILGQGQMSLAKYLMIVNGSDDESLDVQDISAFLQHMLQRIDWRRDLHFQTRTTIDTLDYSGSGFNAGSKVVMAAAGPPQRELPSEVPSSLTLPEGFKDPRVCLPGVLAVQGPAYRAGEASREEALEHWIGSTAGEQLLGGFPLVVLVDDSDFTARTLNNFLWVTFTRSNPAADLHGFGEFVEQKHWGCRGSLVIDARIKPHHAPPLVEDLGVTKKVDALAARGGELAKWL